MPAIPYVKNPTWADGSGGGTSIDAADLNKIEAGIHELSYAPCVRVTHNANQSIASSALPSVLAFNTERFDQCANTADTQHDTAVNNSRLTCRYAGIYQITGQAVWATTVAAGTSATIDIRHQGATVIASGFIPIDYRQMFITTLYALAVNEYVELRVAQATGSAVNITGGVSYSPEFMMVRVG